MINFFKFTIPFLFVVLLASNIANVQNNEVAPLILQLADDDFEIREKAHAELVKIGLPAVDQLIVNLDNADLEISTRARIALVEIYCLDRIMPSIWQLDRKVRFPKNPTLQLSLETSINLNKENVDIDPSYEYSEKIRSMRGFRYTPYEACYEQMAMKLFIIDTINSGKSRKEVYTIIDNSLQTERMISFKS